MISRRGFVLSSLGVLFLSNPAFAIARKPKAAVPAAPQGGPRTLALQEWPPAITPEYVGIVEKGYACFADDMGRIAIVDLKREDNPLVIGELTGLGRKVLGLAFAPYRAYAVVQVEVGADTQFQLVTISLSPPTDPSVLSRVVLENFSEPSCVAAGLDIVAVGGTGNAGDSQIALFSAPKKKAVDPTFAGNIAVSQLPLRMDLQDRTLVALCGADRSDLSFINIANPRVPEKIKSIDLQGAFSAVARYRDAVLVAGSGADKRSYARLINLRPEPNVARSVTLPAVTEILDIAAQRNQFLVLGNNGDRQTVVPLTAGKKNEISTTEPVLLPAGNRGADPRAHIAVKERDAYVASDWGGVQVLNVKKAGWEFTYSHTIPRLPASAVVTSGNKALLASADLKLYDLSDLRRPILTNSIEVGGTVRAMVAIGRSVLCLTREGLTLREIERPSNVLVTMKCAANAMAYDRSTGKVYLAAQKESGASTVTVLKATEDSLKADETHEYPFAIRALRASGGKLLLAGLNDVALYNSVETPQLIGKRNMPNLAVRDLCLSADQALISCVDANLRGYMLMLAGDREDLAPIGSIDLPLDGAAFALTPAKVAVAVGRSAKGKDMAALVNFANPAQPRVIESFEVVEAASAVTVKEQTAIVVGRGIEILSLS